MIVSCPNCLSPNDIGDNCLSYQECNHCKDRFVVEYCSEQKIWYSTRLCDHIKQSIKDLSKRMKK